MCNVSRVMCNMSRVMCHMTRDTYHLSLMPTATNPHPANSPNMHSRLVCEGLRTKLYNVWDIKTLRLTDWIGPGVDAVIKRLSLDIREVAIVCEGLNPHYLKGFGIQLNPLKPGFIYLLFINFMCEMLLYFLVSWNDSSRTWRDPSLYSKYRQN